ncbi:hypothetical protein HDU97_008925 [Phlyctochytrium planicorne]|nr:hypothetical protein HDU97_008925 [Phlyctochytrium planicorne]
MGDGLPTYSSKDEALISRNPRIKDTLFSEDVLAYVATHEGISPITPPLKDAFQKHPINKIWATFRDRDQERRFMESYNVAAFSAIKRLAVIGLIANTVYAGIYVLLEGITSDTYITIGICLYAVVCLAISYKLPVNFVKGNAHILIGIFIIDDGYRNFAVLIYGTYTLYVYVLTDITVQPEIKLRKIYCNSRGKFALSPSLCGSNGVLLRNIRLSLPTIFALLGASSFWKKISESPQLSQILFSVALCLRGLNGLNFNIDTANNRFMCLIIIWWDKNDETYFLMHSALIAMILAAGGPAQSLMSNHLIVCGILIAASFVATFFVKNTLFLLLIASVPLAAAFNSKSEKFTLQKVMDAQGKDIDDEEEEKEVYNAFPVDEEDGDSMGSLQLTRGALKRGTTIVGTIRSAMYQTSIIPIVTARHEGASPVTMSLQEAFENHPIRNLKIVAIGIIALTVYTIVFAVISGPYFDTYMNAIVGVFAVICYLASFFIPKKFIQEKSHIMTAIFVFLIFNPALTISYYNSALKFNRT